MKTVREEEQAEFDSIAIVDILDHAMQVDQGVGLGDPYSAKKFKQ